MSLADQTLAFAAQAADVQTRQQLESGLLSVLEKVGASRFACLYLRRQSGEVVFGPSISNLPRGWREQYRERGYKAADPVLQGVMRGEGGGYWSELTSGMVLDRASQEVMTNAREFDLKDGFTKRVSLDGGGVAVVMAAGEELLRDAEARAAIRMSFNVFANEGARIVSPARTGGAPAPEEDCLRLSLSKTQLRILLMRAEGMSNRQVALLLNRQEKTVECHVTEILRRLDARNMIDAIRIATRLNLIV